MRYLYNGVLFSYEKKLSQKSFNVMEMKDTIFNEMSQKQKDHVLLTICGNLREVRMNIEEEFTGIEQGTKGQKSEEIGIINEHFCIPGNTQ